MQLPKTYKAGKLSQPTFSLKNYLIPYLTIPRIVVMVIMALSLGLQLYNLGSIGDANAYYTATVKSMLQSWHNFFFVAAEPGGSVSVDKPPLGFWIEAIFAFLFGMSGFTVSLPNVLAGVFEIPILYHLIKKYMGELAGLMAALVMALTPVFVATHRHNTIDGMLAFTLLLAAWAFINATETGNWRWALLGGFIVGIGFNIKMSEALLPLPALYALYFLGSKEGWFRKALNLGMASILLVAVSLAWALAVDSVSADRRPFVASTTTNRVMDLVVQQNATRRIFDPTAPKKEPVQPPVPIGGTATTYLQETGLPSAFRLFIAPLSKQSSWLLPFALLITLLLLFGARIRLPVESPLHKVLILWGIWLITCLVLFSVISGIFHAYYTVILAPALAALVGVGFAYIWNLGGERKWPGALLLLAATVTLAFQWFAIDQYQDRRYLIIVAGALLVAGSLLMSVRRQVAHLTIFSAILLVPAYWTLMTALSNPDRTFPSAYTGGNKAMTAEYYLGNNPNLRANNKLITYLQARTQNIKYLVAVPSSLQGSPLVLTSGRAVLYIGGFSGLDHVATANDLAALVARGELHYVLYRDNFRRPGGTSKGNKEILKWLQTSCFVVPEFTDVIIYTRIPRQPPQASDPTQVGSLFVHARGFSVVLAQREDFLTLYACP